MCPFIKTLNEYGITAYRSGVFSSKLSSIENQIDLKETDFTASEHLRDIMQSYVYLVVTEDKLFYHKTKLDKEDVSLDPLLFFNSQLYVSNDEETFVLTDFGFWSDRLREQFSKSIDNHSTYYKNTYPDLMLKRVFDKTATEDILVRKLSNERNTMNQNLSFSLALKELYQLLTQDIQSIMDNKLINQ